MAQERDLGGYYLVIGASGGLGHALVDALQQRSPGRVIAISRQPRPVEFSVDDQDLPWLQCDNSEAGIEATLGHLLPKRGYLSGVFICSGVLHSDSLWPEKKLEDIEVNNLHYLFHHNTVVPMLWLKALLPFVAGDKPRCVITAFSARIGSIDDNKLGGWYGYRSTKAALNMLLKTATVEYARRAPNTKLLSFHPGTTDTELSRPFQGSVPKGKLFSPSFVVRQLLDITDHLPTDHALSFLDWNCEPIPW